MFTKIYQPATIALATLLLAPTSSLAATLVREAAGLNAASIQNVVDQFRADLGNPNNRNAIGPIAGGRREINWDGAPGPAAPFNMPGDFFNATVPRGAVFTTSGSGFQISGADGNPNQTTANIEEFGNINPTYPDIFQTFSPEKLFTALGSNVLDVSFFIPGTNTPATVSG
ncbi:MAG TPA: hypothetical protein DDZ80_13225, partial [Cyanobacteria bacterium UBA8803]|nr:hypothetical protein [Cyanobacteria bacterium UBA8803]